MKYNEKIGCNVHECEHNHNEVSACKLDKIQVTPCGGKGTKTPEDETACGMYSYSENSNQQQTKTNL